MALLAAPVPGLAEPVVVEPELVEVEEEAEPGQFSLPEADVPTRYAEPGSSLPRAPAA